MTSIEVPVLIIGGGGCGLVSSILLSNLGVEHLLVERHESTSRLPKAHYLNQRTMEIFRQHGIADEIYAVGAPIEKMGRVRWQTSLGGDGPIDRRTIAVMDAFGGNSLRERYRADSPCDASNYPQLRLEPLLRRLAEQRGPGRVRFHHEVHDWEQTPTGVVCSVVSHPSGEQITVKARYVIAADGGKTVGPKLGIPMHGPTNMIDFVSTHFSADLSEYWDDQSLITWFLNPEGGSSWGAGALVQVGPTWGRHSEEWVLHFGFLPNDPARFNEDTLVPKIRELLRLPDLQPKVHRISHWELDRVVAERWREGDIFLAGDAAHRQPPPTGLGLNTAIADAHNLTWKIAAVLRGEADASVLDTYEAERKPTASHGADWSMLAFTNRAVIDAGIGLMPGAPPGFNVAAVHALFADDLLGRTLRARASEAVATQRLEFQAHDIELGYAYESRAVIPDGTPAVSRSEFGTEYIPTTRPGHRLPHAWLEPAGQSQPVSTHDLVAQTGGFLLLTGPRGGAWRDAAAAVSEATATSIRTAQVGPACEYSDPTARWAELSAIAEDGALLIRPDQHVAWRSDTAPADAEGALHDAVRRVLGREAS